MKPVFRSLLATAFALALVASVACGGSSSTSSSSGSSKSSAGSSSSGSGSGAVKLDAAVPMPAGFPKDIPIYPNSRLTQQSSFPSGGGQPNWAMAWETLDSLDKVQKYFTDALGKGDFTILYNTASADGGGIIFGRKGNSKVNGTFTFDPKQKKGITEIGLAYVVGS